MIYRLQRMCRITDKSLGFNGYKVTKLKICLVVQSHVLHTIWLLEEDPLKPTALFVASRVHDHFRSVDMITSFHTVYLIISNIDGK